MRDSRTPTEIRLHSHQWLRTGLIAILMIACAWPSAASVAPAPDELGLLRG